jgi:hypothetical protein
MGQLLGVWQMKRKLIVILLIIIIRSAKADYDYDHDYDDDDERFSFFPCTPSLRADPFRPYLRRSIAFNGASAAICTERLGSLRPARIRGRSEGAPGNFRVRGFQGQTRI